MKSSRGFQWHLDEIGDNSLEIPSDDLGEDPKESRSAKEADEDQEGEAHSLPWQRVAQVLEARQGEDTHGKFLAMARCRTCENIHAVAGFGY